MHVLSHFRQTGDSIDQVISKADRMRRGKTQTFQPVDRADSFEQLHEGALAGSAHILCARNARATPREFVAAIQVHDLPKKRHLLHAVRDESANFGYDLSNGA